VEDFIIITGEDDGILVPELHHRDANIVPMVTLNDVQSLDKPNESMDESRG
jgi:hypothetical protein